VDHNNQLYKNKELYTISGTGNVYFLTGVIYSTTKYFYGGRMDQIQLDTIPNYIFYPKTVGFIMTNDQTKVCMPLNEMPSFTSVPVTNNPLVYSVVTSTLTTSSTPSPSITFDNYDVGAATTGSAVQNNTCPVQLRFISNLGD
jgi:hypothetical protein